MKMVILLKFIFKFKNFLINIKKNFFFFIDSVKYKHAFFSMLALVCFLLGILGICLYILRRNYPNFGSNLWQKCSFRINSLFQNRTWLLNHNQRKSNQTPCTVSSLRNQITSSTLTTTAIPNEPKTLTTKCIFTKEKRWRKSKQKSKGKNIQKSETFDSISYDFDDDDTMKVKNWRYHLTNEHL